MIINTNVASLVSQSFLTKANNNLGTVMEQLSSGKRINSAADDAAGLSIATRMTSQSRGMDVAMRNANDGVSLIQTAESALGSIGNILQRMRELAVQADNGTYSTTDKASLKSEMEQLISEIENIADKTQFNGIQLLDGSGGAVTLHVGNGATDTLAFSIADSQTGAIGHASLFLSAIDVTGAGGVINATNTASQDAIQAIDAALDQVSSKRADLGALQNRLEFTIDNLNSNKTNIDASRSRIEDADMAKASSEMTKQKVLVQSGVAMLSQANQSPQMVMQLLQG